MMKIQNSSQPQTSLTSTGLHGHRKVLASCQPQRYVLSHHTDGPDLPYDGVDWQVLPYEEADGGPAALQETSLVSLGGREGQQETQQETQGDTRPYRPHLTFHTAWLVTLDTLQCVVIVRGKLRLNVSSPLSTLS